MKITSAQFEKSYYAIGPGLDIQPLMRFTHLTDTFIYVNLYISKEMVIKAYERYFRWYGFDIVSKEIVNEFDEIDCFELHPQYKTHLLSPDFMTPGEIAEYKNAFKNAIDLPQYALAYKLYKRSTRRMISMYFITGEGVASYMALSQNGRFAPQILSTIETGVLENPESMLNRFFKNNRNKRPLLWIRGFEPRYSNYHLRNNALDELGEFSVKILDFNHLYWCDWCYRPRQKTKIRHCKGFVTPETFEYINSLKFKNEFINENHRFYPGALEQNNGNFKPGDILLSCRNFKTNIKHDGAKKLFIEDLLDYKQEWKNRNQVEHDRYLEKIFDRLTGLNIGKSNVVHIIPFFMEDAGQVYFNTLKNYPFNSITYIKNPFDLIDLKDPSTGHVKCQDDKKECFDEII
jgi:hypothetical protein